MAIFKNKDIEANINERTVELGNINANFYTEDEQTASIRIFIKWNNHPINLNKVNMKPVLNLYMEDGSIFEGEKVEIIIPESGVIQYKIPSNVIKHVGKVKAKLLLENETDSIHVANFNFTIVDSGTEEPVRKELSFNLVDEAIRRIVQISAIELLGDDFENRLNEDVVKHLDSNPELFKGEKGDTGEQGIQGERGLKGDTGERGPQGDSGITPDIEAYENESKFTNKKINEKNYMKFLEDNSAITDKNYITINSDRNLDIDLMKSENEKFILNFKKNNNDDFLKFRTVDLITKKVTESTEEQTIYKDFTTDMINNPTNVKGSGNNYYANTIGTTLTFEFTGSSIKMRYYSDANGGVWQASIDGTVIKNISTNIGAQTSGQSLGSSTWEETIAENLENKEHTLVLEFIGQDEAYPVESPRGWLKKDTGQYNLNTFVYVLKDGEVIVDSERISVLTDSNKEFAFETRYNDVREWIPQHNTVGTLKINNKGSQKLFIDGEEHSINNALPSTQFNEIQILQHLYGVRSSNNLEVCEMISVTTITSRGVKFNTKFKWLTEALIANGYVNMFTVHPDFADTLVTSYGGNYNMKQYDGEYEYIQEEAPYSFVALSNTYPDFYVTCDNVNGYRTLRLGEPNVSGDKYGKGLFGLQHRDNTLQKLYPKTYLQHTTSVDEVYEFEGFYGFGKLPMANELLK